MQAAKHLSGRNAPRFKSIGIATLSLGALLAIGFHWIHPGQIIAQGDSFFGYDQFNELAKGFWAWNHVAGFFGQPDATVAWTPWLIIAGTFTRLLGPSVSQILMIWLMMSVGWLGVYSLTRRLGASELAAFFAAWSYALNPWTQLFLGSGSNPPLLWLAALLPWYGVWITRGALDPAYRRTAALAMGLTSFSFLALVAANPALVVLFLIAFCVFVGLSLILTTDHAGFARWIARSAVFVAVGALWWLVPVVYAYLGSVPAAVISPGGWSFVIGRSSLLNNLRLNPMWGWAHPEYFPYAQSYDANPLTYISGFLLIFGLAAALALAKGERARMIRYIAIVVLIALFLSKGLHAPLAQLNSLFYAIPGMFLFREPTSKFPLIALLMLAIALAVAIDLVREKLFGKPLARAAIVLLVPCAIALSAWAMLTGEINHGYTANYHNNVPGLPPVYIRLPQYWREAADYLNVSPGDGGVLVLPADSFYQVDYSWGYYGADLLPNWLLRRRVMMLGPLYYVQLSQAAALQEWVKRAIDQSSPLLPRMLRDVGIQYVLYRGDVHIPPGPDSYQLKRADPSREFGKPRITFGPLDIYDLGKPTSAVTESADWIAGEYGVSSAADRVELRELEESVPRIDAFSLPRDIDRPPRAFEIRDDVPGPENRNVYQNIRAGVLTTNAPARIIASGNSGPGFGFIRVGATATVRASFLGLLPNPSTIRVPPNALYHDVRNIGHPLLTTTRLFSDDQGRMIVQVANPAMGFVRSDIRIAVMSSAKTAFFLEGQALSYADTLQPSSTVVWARFENVMLSPGENQFVLYAQPTRFGNARKAEGINSLRIGMVRFDNVQLAGKPIVAYTPAIGAHLTRGVHPAALLGGFPLHLGESSESSATVSLTALSPSFNIGANLTIASGAQRYRCYMRIAPIEPGDSTDIDTAIARCFDEASQPYDRNRLVIERVDLEGTLPPDEAEASSNFAVNELTITTHTLPSSELALARASVTADTADAIVARNGENLDVTLWPTTRLKTVELLGRNVDVHMRSGDSFAGRVVANNGSLIEMQLKNSGDLWVPLGSVSEIVDRDAGFATVHVRVPANMPFDQSRKISLAIDATSVRNSALRVETSRKSRPIALFETPDQQSAFAVVPIAKLLEGSHGSVHALDVTFRTLGPLVGTSTAMIALNVLENSPRYINKVTIGKQTVGVDPQSRSFFAKTVSVKQRELPVQIETDDARLSTLSVGPPPCKCDTEIPADVIKNADGFIVAKLPTTGPAFVLTNELYSWQWVGVLIHQSISLMPHLAADGWRNAWIATTDGTVVLLNIATALQLLLMISGASVLAYLFVTKR